MKLNKIKIQQIVYLIFVVSLFLLIGCNGSDNMDNNDNNMNNDGNNKDVDIIKDNTLVENKLKDDDITNPIIILETTAGKIEVELFEESAPISSKNFIDYVNEGYYDGLIFHRVIDNFMVQGGGFDKEMNQKPGKAPIKNEADNGLLNEIGTVAMARTHVIDSATSQFFINVADNTFLNHRDDTIQGYGYAVFGKVVSGMDVVDQIKTVKTHMFNGFDDVPITQIIINKAYVKK